MCGLSVRKTDTVKSISAIHDVCFSLLLPCHVILKLLPYVAVTFGYVRLSLYNFFIQGYGTLHFFSTAVAVPEKKRSLPTPRGKISFFLRFGEPLSLRENGVLKSPHRSLKKTDTPVWVCPFLAAIQGFEPRQAESEAAVLPLHYIAIPRLTYQAFILYYILKICQGG